MFHGCFKIRICYFIFCKKTGPKLATFLKNESICRSLSQVFAKVCRRVFSRNTARELLSHISQKFFKITSGKKLVDPSKQFQKRIKKICHIQNGLSTLNYRPVTSDFLMFGNNGIEMPGSIYKL